MKKTLIVLALFAAFGAQAQTSNAGSNSASTSNPVVSSGNQVGNSGANSNSASTSNPNNANAQYIQLNTLTPDHQTVDQNVNYSGSQKVKNVPGIAMSGPASGPCTGASGGVGVAGPGFGVGLNGAKVDDGCTVRENTRVLGQLFQALDSADPMKAQARDALLKSMTILDAMNDKIGGDYVKPKADTQPAKVSAAPAAPVAATPVMMPATNVGYAGNDPYVKARLGMK